MIKSFKFRRRLLTSLLLASSAMALGAGLKGAPAPFDQGGVKVALVGYISGGDFFRAFNTGAQHQAQALKIDLRVFPGKEDAALQREQIQQAINLGVKAIIIDHGQPESVSDLVRQALDAGIKVVAFDINLNNPQVIQIDQSDRDLAGSLLDLALKQNGKAFKAGYVYVPGFAPLDRRDAVWASVKRANPGIVERARWGSVAAPVPTAVAAQANAALRAHPEISVVFAPWDEFARGTKLAAVELGRGEKLKIYSADVSTADIAEIREPGSPWVATAATNPAVLGATSVRAAALALAHQPVPKLIEIKPVLITREALNRYDIKTVEQLEQKLPSFGRNDAALARWIPVAQ